jgi:phosphoribosylamine-glycine ligase
MNLSNKKALVYDLGLFTENALRLLRDCASVKYFVPWADAFPEPFKAKIGEGLDGMERVGNFEEHLDEADFIFVPDTLCAGLVEWLKKHEYPVAGAGAAEKLELDRWHGRMRQKENGLPVQETHRVKGVTALHKFIGENKNYFIKIDLFRGIEESFKHIDEHQTEWTVDRIAYKLGPYKEDVVFICEELLEGVEPGIDAITWEGELIFPAACGYEGKGSGVIERVYRTQADLPEAVKWINEGLAPEFKKHKTRFFYSAEFKIGKDRTPYLIDPTIRLAAPGVAAIQTELFENYAEVIYGMATAEKVAPIISHKYAAALALESQEARETWVNVGFPKELRRWLKLRMAVRKGEDYYCVPGFESVGTVIGFGDTVRAAVDLVKARAQQVKGKRLTMDDAGLDVLADEINKGKQYGINF